MAVGTHETTTVRGDDDDPCYIGQRLTARLEFSSHIVVGI